MHKKNDINALDLIPNIILSEWNTSDNGMVVVTVENKGFFNKVAQMFFHKPKVSYIRLDEFGSCVFRNIDGSKTIYEIGPELIKEYPDSSYQLYERLTKYFEILRSNKYISFINAN